MPATSRKIHADCKQVSLAEPETASRPQPEVKKQLKRNEISVGFNTRVAIIS